MILGGIRAKHLEFGFSEARETLRAIQVLSFPAAHAEQMPWVRTARRRLSASLRAEIEHFKFFFGPVPEIFPGVWGKSRRSDFESEMTALERALPAYRDAVVMRLSGARLFTKQDVERLRVPKQYRALSEQYAQDHPQTAAMLAEFSASPAHSLARFCATLRTFHAHVIETAWGTIHSRLLADVEMRRAILKQHGLAPLLRTLSSGVSVGRSGRSGYTLRFDESDRELHLDDRARITLTPSFFCWPGIHVLVLHGRRGIRCTLVYPVPALPARAAAVPDRAAAVRAFSALGESTRLRIVELLNARDLSTRELAGFLKLAEPVISRHLQVLLRADLLERRRSGHFVMYVLRRDAVRRVAAALSLFGGEK